MHSRLKSIYFCNGKIIKIKDNTYVPMIFFQKVFFIYIYIMLQVYIFTHQFIQELRVITYPKLLKPVQYNFIFSTPATYITLIIIIKFKFLFSEEDYDAFCLAYMFTYRDFEMGTLGLAWTGDLKNAGGVCEKNGVSIYIEFCRRFNV